MSDTTMQTSTVSKMSKYRMFFGLYPNCFDLSFFFNFLISCWSSFTELLLLWKSPKRQKVN